MIRKCAVKTFNSSAPQQETSSVNIPPHSPPAPPSGAAGSAYSCYDNALAETIIGLFKTEIIRQRGPWRGIDAVEFATLEWVDWFNRRLFESIGNLPPAEKEDEHYRQRELAMVA